MTEELPALESDWLAQREMYAASPQPASLHRAVAAGEAYVAALHRAGRPVPAKLADGLALLVDLAS
ncbi:MAG TPA: hypothetical protein VGX23_03555 [Actinocrinis sp.]|nr:hypothetical protein [Actinocrinis sp.]